MLKWNSYPNGDKSCYTDLGILHIVCSCGREYKDGTHQYKIYVSIPTADTPEVITLTKIRGTLNDAKTKAETLFSDLILNK